MGLSTQDVDWSFVRISSDDDFDLVFVDAAIRGWKSRQLRDSVLEFERQEALLRKFLVENRITSNLGNTVVRFYRKNQKKPLGMRAQTLSGAHTGV